MSLRSLFDSGIIVDGDASYSRLIRSLQTRSPRSSTRGGYDLSEITMAAFMARGQPPSWQQELSNNGAAREGMKQSPRSMEEVLLINDPQLNLLRTLVLWSLSSSDIISATIKDAYKHTRADNDVNLPLSVQPWGKDGDNRNYWLIEGLDDTNFRLYRESSRALKTNTWWNMAGSIDEIKEVATKLDKEATQASRRLSARIMSAIPRFEATEEV